MVGIVAGCKSQTWILVLQIAFPQYFTFIPIDPQSKVHICKNMV